MQLSLIAAAMLGTTHMLDVALASRAWAASMPVGPAGEWQLIFEDEFTDDELNSDKWVKCYWWDAAGCTNLGNREEQWYLPGNVSVSDGMLRLKAQREMTANTTGIYEYSSGMVTTGRVTYDQLVPTRFDFQYGYAEIRARAPRGQGLWPAFWLLPSRHAPIPEIDVMEILGQEIETLYYAFHYRDQIGKKRARGHSFKVPDLSEDWHVFGVEWSPERIIWYFDGVEQWRYDDARYVPHEPMYMIINLAIGGIWARAADETTEFPAELAVDYVRVWQQEE